MRKHGIVAAGHPETVEAARLILEGGGNAFDAALAALCAACVAEPVLASLAGGGFLVAHDGDRPRLYDFFAQTPKRRRRDEELDFFPIVADFGGTHQEFHIGTASIAVPGVARGVFRVHRDLGSLPLRRIVEPAIALARDGVVMNSLQAYIFDIVGPIYASRPETFQVYRSQRETGSLIRAGERFRLPQLADTLEILAIEGERLFYEGEIAALLAEYCVGNGGHLTADDLADYRVKLRDPLRIDAGGAKLYTNPPPSSGGILIAFALELLESSRRDSWKFGTAEHLQALVRVMELTNRARVETALRDLAPERQSRTLLDPDLLARYRREVLDQPASHRGTTHISVLDSDGRAASLTVSNGEGSGFLIPGTGIMTNNMLGEEDINPHGFHRWPTDRRIASMMSPTLALWRDGRAVALGSGGSNRIRTAILQVLSNVIDFRMGIDAAVNAPRIHFENGFLDVEGGFPESSTAGLAASFPEHRIWDDLNLFFGGVHSVELSANGDLRGAGDPRRGGTWAKA